MTPLKCTGWKLVLTTDMQDGLFRKRKLPHWDVDGAPVFITACLSGSLSSKGLGRILRKREELERQPRSHQLSHAQWNHTKSKLIFKLVDELLDGDTPLDWLRDPRQATIVEDAFFHFADSRYSLMAYVVMPTHHHWLFIPDEVWARETIDSRKRTPRESISHSIQSYTANRCNKILNRTGSYWQTETYDHWVRDEEEMKRILYYIEHNPVKAGLVQQANQWRFSSAWWRAKCGLSAHEPLPKNIRG